MNFEFVVAPSATLRSHSSLRQALRATRRAILREATLRVSTPYSWATLSSSRLPTPPAGDRQEDLN
ncbi:hypothetical protein [Chroococcidiopsis sp.]|uniref:hypothetical protein n=1 Tax=Chroococcidiopsis sp. TaxID=3088168 RepID=UPI003F2B34E8